MKLQPAEIWFVTGSQHLYGPETLKQVAEHSAQIVAGLNASARIPLPLVFKPVLKTPEEIRQLCLDANHAPECAGLILWMHTFSPSKMWIGGLSALKKPFLHLHTQFNRDLPWSTIDMDFMNLNQAAHGDREVRKVGVDHGRAAVAAFVEEVLPLADHPARPRTRACDLRVMGGGVCVGRFEGRRSTMGHRDGAQRWSLDRAAGSAGSSVRQQQQQHLTPGSCC